MSFFYISCGGILLLFFVTIPSTSDKKKEQNVPSATHVHQKELRPPVCIVHCADNYSRNPVCVPTQRRCLHSRAILSKITLFLLLLILFSRCIYSSPHNPGDVGYQCQHFCFVKSQRGLIYSAQKTPAPPSRVTRFHLRRVSKGSAPPFCNRDDQSPLFLSSSLPASFH